MKAATSDSLFRPIQKTLRLLVWFSAFILHPSSFILSAQVVARAPRVIVKPASGPAPTDTPADNQADASPNLQQQLKETKDRLQHFEADNAALRRRNDLSKQTIHALNESLAVANAECEVFKRQYGELKLRMEALGLAAVGDNKEALEQRLLKSVSDLRLLREAKDKIAERMMGLCEAVMLYMKTSTGADPQIRMDVEGQIRAANDSVADTTARDAQAIAGVPADLANGKIVSVNEDISLVVVNLGREQGVKIGMPFQIVRDNRYVGRARVVDVRDRISGAIVEEYSSNTEKVKVGDTMRVDVQS